MKQGQLEIHGRVHRVYLANLGLALMLSACTSSTSVDSSKSTPPAALASPADGQSSSPAVSKDPEPGTAAASDVVAEVQTPLPTRDLSQAKVPSNSDVTQMVSADFAKAGSTTDIVYADIRHLAQKQVGTQELDIYRFGLAKSLNSVSINPSIVKLSPIDPAETIFRIKLSDFTLNQGWKLIMGDKNAAANSTKIGGATVVKGDWLVYAVSRPEIYDPIMNIPASVAAFESQLHPDYSKAVYINATNSTVTFYGRVLQRIPLEVGGKPGGYYWRSYDVDGLPEQSAAFAAPQALRAATLPTLVAGEYFFSLPNGMQGYYVSGFAMQTRLDAQLFVATDFRRPQDKLTTCVGDNVKSCGLVLNGESCMTCHENGVNVPKTIQGTSGAGTAQDISALLAKDTKRFTDSLAEMGYGISSTEPINATLAAFRKRAGITDSRVQGGELEGVMPVGLMFKR